MKRTLTRLFIAEFVMQKYQERKQLTAPHSDILIRQKTRLWKTFIPQAAATTVILTCLAVKHIREHAEEYHIDPKYVFITGFSAGGHFSAMCGTLWNDPVVREALGIDRGEAPEGINRPTATVLCYPVISGGPFAHRGSINRLCGGPSEGTAGADRYSLELHVDATTAPAFIWHTFDDTVVPIQNSLLYANAMAAAGVPFEYHVFTTGVHGLSLCNKETWCGSPDLISDVCSVWIKDAIRYVTEFEA